MTSEISNCLVPARGGSHRFPRKNIAPLAGRPLLGWAIEAARASGLFGDVWVSTEDAEIGAVAARHGASVHRRPDALAGDEATVVDVLLEFADHRAAAGVEPEYLGIVLPTAALLTGDDLRDAWALLRVRRADVAMGVTTYLESPFQALEEVDGHLRLFFGSGGARPGQKRPRVVVDSGQFYLARVAAVRAARTLYVDGLVGYPIPRERSVDIDEPAHLLIAEALLDAAGRSEGGWRVEPAGAGHARLVWQWANDPVARQNSFTTEPIPWEAHCAWWEGAFASPHIRMWMLLERGRPVAQIRYERAAVGAERAAVGAAEVSVSVASSDRGRGIGTRALRMTAPLAVRELGVSELVAWVKVGNLASVRIFEKAGYARAGPLQVRGVPAYRFELAAATAVSARA